MKKNQRKEIYKASRYNFIVDSNEFQLLIFNTFTGCVCRLEKSVWIKINEGNFSNEIPHFASLLKQGIIVQENLDELGKIITNESIVKYSSDFQTLTCVIAPTLRCNLRCFYCFESSQNETVIMSDQTMSGIVRYLEKKFHRAQKNSISDGLAESRS